MKVIKVLLITFALFCVAVILVGIGIPAALIAGGAFVKYHVNNSVQAAAPQTSAQSPQNNVNAKRLATCRAKLKKAQKLDVLHDLQWNLPSEPRVVAGPTFFNIPIDAKEGFANTVNCFLNAGRDSYVSFDILDWRSGKAVGRYSAGRLTMN